MEGTKKHYIIAARNNDKIWYGSLPKVARLTGVNPVTIHRWIKSKKEVKIKGDFEIFLNLEKL